MSSLKTPRIGIVARPTPELELPPGVMLHHDEKLVPIPAPNRPWDDPFCDGIADSDLVFIEPVRTAPDPSPDDDDDVQPPAFLLGGTREEAIASGWYRRVRK